MFNQFMIGFSVDFLNTNKLLNYFIVLSNFVRGIKTKIWYSIKFRLILIINKVIIKNSIKTKTINSLIVFLLRIKSIYQSIK